MIARLALVLVAVAALIAAGWAGWSWYAGQGDALPVGIVVGNGRIEAEQVDVSARIPGRVLSVLAREGEMVEPGQELARMDTEELEAALDRAEAEAALARETKLEAEAVVLQRESELRLAEHELSRAKSLLDRGHTTQAVYDERQTARDVAEATLRAARARVATAGRQVAAAEAEARRIHAQLDDAVLTAPVAGRVLYRLAEPGEVVAGGEPVLTLLDLSEIYMEIFLPADEAGLLPMGAEARIVLDVLPEYAIPAYVSFVSPEAQFTPRQVETMQERESLVFRVRVKIPEDLVQGRIRHVKTGVRGVAYVRLRPSVEWPEALERRIPPELFE